MIELGIVLGWLRDRDGMGVEERVAGMNEGGGGRYGWRRRWQIWIGVGNIDQE